jgi:hypothetical protein
MQLNELSRRMETMTEQVLPFAPIEERNPDIVYKEDFDPASGEGAAGGRGHGNTPATVVANNSHAVPHQSSVWSNDQRQFVMANDRLANFYKKYNKILLDNIAIGKEKERLATENAQLQDLIQQYLEGTGISDQVLADDNPLFVVNGRYVFDVGFSLYSLLLIIPFHFFH